MCIATVTISSGASSATPRSRTAREAAVGHGQAAPDPLSKDRLVKLLKLNDSTPQELVQIVTRKGVDFQPTADDEKQLRQAGAKDDLIAAVRTNYRDRATTNNAAANNAATTAGQTDAQTNQAQTNQPMNVAQPANTPATADPQAGKTAAAATPAVGFHGFQVGTYKGDAKDRQYTQKLEFKIDSIDEKTGAVHAQFYGSQSYRAWDLNGKIDEDGALRLEGRISGPNSQIIGHIDGGVITGKYRIADLNGVDGEFTVKFTPDDFADEFNKKKVKPND